MKLTPLDIRKQEFDRSLRGFNPREVQHFLDIVATQWDEMANERRRLEEKVRDLENKLEHYERVEEALQEALQTARENAEQKVANAEREAELIVSEAEAEARAIRQAAKEERDELRRDTENLDDRRGEIVARLRSFLMAEMELLARFEGDDPIGFIKLLPNEERKTLREAGVDLEQISPHFEEVGEQDAEADDEVALDDEQFDASAAQVPDDVPSDSEDDREDRMTAEEENELSALFDAFDSDPAADAEHAADESPAAATDDPLDEATPEPETTAASATGPDTERSVDEPADTAPSAGFETVDEPESAGPGASPFAPKPAVDEDTGDDAPAPPTADPVAARTEPTPGEQDASATAEVSSEREPENTEKKRDFRVNSILSAGPSKQQRETGAAGAEDAASSPAAEKSEASAGDEHPPADERNEGGESAEKSSEEIERIRRILKNME